MRIPLGISRLCLSEGRIRRAVDGYLDLQADPSAALSATFVPFRTSRCHLATSGIVADYLIDTDVFVDHLRGARELEPKSHRIHYSVVTRAELFAGNTAKEIVGVLLAPFREIEVGREIAERGWQTAMGVGHPVSRHTDRSHRRRAQAEPLHPQSVRLRWSPRGADSGDRLNVRTAHLGTR
jgi:hypothetical protein